MTEPSHLAQQGDSMFERNIAIIAMNNREVAIQMAGGYTVVGFVAGLDDQNIQVCKTANARYAICNREQILTYEETGRNLKDSPIVDDVKEDLISHTNHFARVAKAFNTHKAQTDAVQ